MICGLVLDSSKILIAVVRFQLQFFNQLPNSSHLYGTALLFSHANGPAKLYALGKRKRKRKLQLSRRVHWCGTQERCKSGAIGITLGQCSILNSPVYLKMGA
jgi:hypothetical protein